MTASSRNGVPGPKIEAAFEANCDCDLKWVGVADGVALLNRLKLEGEKAEAGVVLGLDTNLVAEAKATGLFEAHGLDTAAISVPGGFSG
jgi:thiamine transport system substrate-binding protein